MITVVEKALEARPSTHGDFKDNADVSQGIKRLIQGAPSYHLLSDTQKEVVDMVAHKLSRIAAGDPNTLDHWVDLAGYASIAVRELQLEQGVDDPADLVK